ncbi:hypothetical protein JH06_3593 [Blastocystis sp. subtype 4]|uniref:hypothetical protein n=1 Tax=Blastocystis sp. subtype 4 TaxID=944170 RepID=UPI000711D967|nr:hypothetical protein JH06_3593 [Blastocystis sp. subtype 4]KNB45552.1 hypothetical protein JH06_3593 [Blastocystis sp. subtype 4]|eukprot:XP_014529014.1 hypothetical protein JH06_3593 [Blastocystis sp. subtype 4]
MLSCKDNSLGNEGFRHLVFFLRRCSSLSYLNVAQNHITGKILPIIADFLENASCIKRIDISGMLMEPTVVELFKKLSGMTGCELILSEDTE